MGRRCLSIRTLCLIGVLLGVAGWSGAGEASGEVAEPATLPVAERVRRLLDLGRVQEAGALLEASRSGGEASADLLYQWARFHLMSPGAALYEDSMVGYRYARSAADRATRVLQQVLQRTPDDPAAYSLLLHIAAVQGDIQQARKWLRKALALGERHEWLSFNQALLHLREDDLDRASRILQDIVKQNAVRRSSSGKLYRNAWSLLRNLGVRNPRYDPVPAIRKGWVKRVLYAEFPRYLEDHADSDRLLFVHMASSDPWCGPCIKSTSSVERLAERFHDRVDFVRVSLEPWTDVRFAYYWSRAIFGVPALFIYYRGRLLDLIQGYAEGNTPEYFLHTALLEIEKGVLNRLEAAQTPADHCVLAFTFRHVVRDYRARDAHGRGKVLALRVNKAGCSAYRVMGVPGVDMVEKVLEDCRKDQEDASACRLYAINDVFVYKGHPGMPKRVVEVMREDFAVAGEIARRIRR